ncbi:MAG: hypothetical protein Q9222_003892 [Ikaeria aurantiellina]
MSTAPQKRAISFVENWDQILTEEGTHYITAMPAWALTTDQRERLRRIHDHFLPSPGNQSTIDNDVEQDADSEDLRMADAENPGAADTRERARSAAGDTDGQLPAATGVTGKRGRPRTSGGSTSTSKQATSTQWGALMIHQEFKLPEHSRQLLDHNPSDYLAQYRLREETLRRVLKVGNFPQVCHDIIKMAGAKKGSSPQQRIRRLFGFLAISKIASKLFGAVWEWSGLVLKTRLTAVHEEPYHESVESALRIARSLAFLCDRFGVGCIFWLFGDLTDNSYVPSPA